MDAIDIGTGRLDDLRAAVYDAAHREWWRLSGLRREARLALVTETVWHHSYRIGFDNSAARVAATVDMTATRAADESAAPTTDARMARRTLNQLAHAAGRPRRAPLIPPACADTLAAVLATPPGQDQARHVADLTWPAALRSGGVAGIVTTSADIIIEWRRLAGDGRLAHVRVGDQPVMDWANERLREVNRLAASVCAWTATSNAEYWERLAQHESAANAGTRLHDLTAAAASPTARPVPVSLSFPRLAVPAGPNPAAAATQVSAPSPDPSARGSGHAR